jgi:hypothetical protein
MAGDVALGGAVAYDHQTEAYLPPDASENFTTRESSRPPADKLEISGWRGAFPRHERVWRWYPRRKLPENFPLDRTTVISMASSG